MPTTSVFSRTDGVVSWPLSYQRESKHAENIEVMASHIGLGMNPIALCAIADQLAQAEGARSNSIAAVGGSGSFAITCATPTRCSRKISCRILRPTASPFTTNRAETKSDPVILMIMGLGVQMILWPEPLIDLLVQHGFRVVRFDNRDVGLSSRKRPDARAKRASASPQVHDGLPVKAPYRIEQMAADTAALIDALGLVRPHVVGASMGGMIGQNLAANYPEKVASLTSIMSTTGRRSLPKPTWDARRAILQPPARRGDIEGAIHRMMHVFRAIGSRTFPPNQAHMREVCERHVNRSHYPAGAARQLLAIAASGDRTAVIRRIKAPTLVIHGDEDPLVPLACGVDTARVINDGGGSATFSVIKGMGHDFPLPLLPRVAEEIVAHCRNGGVKGSQTSS
ncbi:MAG: alpha/beta hydrolase [Betaproteobacteria bacterium]|nr:alpha/beta hydrolase [Betaproteobacteria bacterium]